MYLESNWSRRLRREQLRREIIKAAFWFCVGTATIILIDVIFP